MGIQREEPEKWESSGNFVVFGGSLLGVWWEFSGKSPKRRNLSGNVEHSRKQRAGMMAE